VQQFFLQSTVFLTSESYHLLTSASSQVRCTKSTHEQPKTTPTNTHIL